MKPGANVEVLVGTDGSAAWVPGKVTRVNHLSRAILAHPFDEDERYDVVRSDTGSLLLGCHPSSVRAVVVEGQS